MFMTGVLCTVCGAQVYLQIEQDILSHSVDYPYLAIIGDANSRTGILPDFIDIVDDELDVDLIANDINLLDTLNIPRVRKSCDTQRNNFGVQLLNLCKNTNLFIANGRIGADKDVGDFTCKDTSVIDYCIGNVNFLSIVDKFEVLPFSCLSSDVHNALFIELNGVHSILTNDTANTENNNHVHRIDQISVNRWKDDT